jgi:predicted PolB exonuclease-like 3'-5' exonuclease
MIYRNEDVLHSTKVCDMIMQEKIVIWKFANILKKKKRHTKSWNIM